MHNVANKLLSETVQAQKPGDKANQISRGNADNEMQTLSLIHVLASVLTTSINTYIYHTKK
jgi:hypothetical protein